MSLVSNPSAPFSTSPSQPAAPVSDLAGDFERLNTKLPRPRTTFGYFLAQGLVTGLMLLMPLLYLGIVALLGYGLYYYAVNHHDWITGGWGNGPRGRAMIFYAIFRVSCYLAPLLAGACLLLSLLKPLLARPVASENYVRAVPSTLGDFGKLIRAVCVAVGAPYPAELRLSVEFNASAGPVRGFGSLMRGELALEIGLPLVAVMDVRELAGVLAHEFGHFTQRRTIFVQGVVDRVNGWLARAVHSRDAWDVWLAEAQQSLIGENTGVYGGLLGLVFALIRLTVWIGRMVLMLIMLLAHAISSGVTRQMEYDADAYSFPVAGAGGFNSLQHKLAGESVAVMAGMDGVRREIVEHNRLPSNLVSYLMAARDLQPAKLREQAASAAKAEKTGLFDSHPSLRDRCSRARSNGARTLGLVRSTIPARTLLPNWDEWCRRASEADYLDNLGAMAKVLSRTDELPAKA